MGGTTRDPRRRVSGYLPSRPPVVAPSSALAARITKPFYLDDAKFAVMAKTGVRGQEQAAMLGSHGADSLQVLLSGSKSMSEAVGHVTTALVSRGTKML